jgi:hypothetical protein
MFTFPEEDMLDGKADTFPRRRQTFSGSISDISDGMYSAAVLCRIVMFNSAMGFRTPSENSSKYNTINTTGKTALMKSW